VWGSGDTLLSRSGVLALVRPPLVGAGVCSRACAVSATPLFLVISLTPWALELAPPGLLFCFFLVGCECVGGLAWCRLGLQGGIVRARVGRL